jgi:hypothetical protein
MTKMYNPLNAQLMLMQADELRHELQEAHHTSGARRWWRREHATHTAA